MTGTKVVKLRLEDSGTGGLPNLKEGVVGRAVKLYEDSTCDVVNDYYAMMAEATRDFDVRPAELQRIIDIIEKKSEGDFDDNKKGAFLTVLMQNSRSQAFRIKIKSPVSCLGVNLKGDKKITVVGDLLDETGACMEGGEIHVKGNVKDYTGSSMTGGKITVDGNAEDLTGTAMAGGIITVKGNVGENTSLHMTGGKLEVGGEIAGISGRVHGGEIYNKGERVWPR
ncbi:MAG: hypothetical protein V1921_06490 [Candidatus Altiarchaeota archaeon]